MGGSVVMCVDATCLTPQAPDRGLIEAACRRLHAAAGKSVPAALHHVGRLVLCAFSASGGPPRIAGFAIGDWQAMGTRAYAWADCRDYNVYFAPAILPEHVIAKGSRGTDDDILAVFAMGCDVDRDHGCDFEVNGLEIPPGLDVLSSTAASVDGFNHNLVWLLDQAIAAAEARPLTSALARMIGDNTGNASSPGHVWRLPGTLNWPSKAKLARGRAPIPTIADMRPLDLQLVSVANLESMLAAKGVDVDAPKRDNPKRDESRTDAAPQRDAAATAARPARWSGDHWQGDPADVLRLLDALHVLPNDCSRSDWRRHLHQIADYFMGSRNAAPIARWWSAGGHIDPHVLLTAQELEDVRARARARRRDVERMIGSGLSRSRHR